MAYSEADVTTAALDTPQEAGEGPRGIVARWLLELDLAAKCEKGWRDEAKEAISRYRGGSVEGEEKKGERNEHNILWANVEVLRPTLYNSQPRPDVRRRFRDKDEVGREIAEVIERALSFSIDAYDFDTVMTDAVFDYLLPGRSVTRIGYKPYTTQEPDPMTGKPMDVVSYEEANCEHVNWKDFRRGPGRVWDEVDWIAFRHHLNRAQVREQFPEHADIPLNIIPDQDKLDSAEDVQNKDVFKKLEVWEIWDKVERTVIWVAPSFKDGPIGVDEDPLELEQFYPIPRPLMAISSTDTLLPATEYSQYAEQAKELDTVTKRIRKLTEQLKVRGIYDARLTEAGSLFDANDGDFLPAQNIAALLEQGGLDKALHFLPIEKWAQVLQVLYEQRERIRQVIFEITGISDIIRGQSDPNETLGAQQLKANWGSQRIARRQKEVARYARDLLRLKAEIICNHFQPQTLSIMSGREVTEEMMAVLRDDTLREYKIDVETDSTVAGDENLEKQQMTELIGAIGGFVQQVGPAVQMGAIPQEVAQQIMLAAIRKFHMRDIEELLDTQGEEQQQLPPEVEQAMQEMQQQLQEAQQQLEQADVAGQQLEQAKAESDAQIKQAELQASSQVEAAKMQSEQAKEDAKNQLELAKLQAQQQAEQLKADTQIQIAEIKRQTDLEIAHIKIQADAERATRDEQRKQSEDSEGKAKADSAKSDSEAVGGAIGAIVKHLNQPKKVIRDETGRVSGVEPAGDE